MKIDKNNLANCFLIKKWNSNENVIKIVILDFIYTLLLSYVANRNFISDQHFYLVEIREYISPPSGEVGISEIDGLYKRQCSIRKFYSFCGFPLDL